MGFNLGFKGLNVFGKRTSMSAPSSSPGVWYRGTNYSQGKWHI